MTSPRDDIPFISDIGLCDLVEEVMKTVDLLLDEILQALGLQALLDSFVEEVKKVIPGLDLIEIPIDLGFIANITSIF